MKILNLCEFEKSETEKLFDQTATAQRGAPERQMGKIQHLIGGGVFSYVIEHVGDITHRMSEQFDFMKGSLHLVQDKIEKSLRTLEQGYGFEREMKENLRSNFQFRTERGTSEHDSYEEFHTEVEKLSREYADLHRKIPVFNEPQAHARAAAVALGEWKFYSARVHLRWLLRLTENPEKYKHEVSQVTRGHQ